VLLAMVVVSYEIYDAFFDDGETVSDGANVAPQRPSPPTMSVEYYYCHSSLVRIHPIEQQQQYYYHSWLYLSSSSWDDSKSYPGYC
jgi:hypothetical protein